ncbi:hypothetical protein CEP53_000242 [Fusarium sp. AF-6]|nr:hypothetical protein CEP53_000242 [Fusarium sp. AF-6]
MTHCIQLGRLAVGGRPPQKYHGGAFPVIDTSEDQPRFTVSPAPRILSCILPSGSTPRLGLCHSWDRMDPSVSSPMASRSRGDAGSSRGKFIAIGIDFGTTFSGVSWAFSEQPDVIHEISEWPAASHTNQQEVQVPTVYDIASGKWGFQVTPDMKPVKWFKLLLLNENDMAKEENLQISRSKQLRDARSQLSKCSEKMTAISLVGCYLEKLWNHAYAILKTMMPIDDIPLRVSITVPAIWPHYAQNAMREAAKLAGITAKRSIGATTLDLVQEPEAASLSIMREHGLLANIKPGECFVVCDAGGGTVDVISYTVVSNNPFRLKECVKGEGGLCGAVQIDEAFEAHLLGKNRLKLDSLNASEYNTLVVEGWERGVKRTFTNAETPTEFSLRLPMKAFKTRDKLRNRDHFSVNRSEVYGFFSKSLTGIRTLISNQREQVQKETQKFPRETLSVGQQRVLATLPNVTARKSRYSYGIRVEVRISQLSDYDENLDEAFCDQAGDMVASRMTWYLKRGEEVSGRSPVTFSYHRYYKLPMPKTCTLNIQCSSAESPPERSDSTVQDLCTIECDFDTSFDEWEPVGDPDDGYRSWNFRVGSQKATTADARVTFMNGP